MLFGVTVGENNVNFVGVHLGQVVNWAVILLAAVVVSQTSYRCAVPIILLLIFGLRILELFGFTNLHCWRVGVVGWLFAVSGAAIYGREPHLIKQHLLILLLLCIPLMIAQMAGISAFFMSWNAEYHLDPTQEIDGLKQGVLFPTLFISLKDLHYFVGQGRPVGLLYSNNILSIFILLAFAVNLKLGSHRIFNFGHLIVALAAVLSMSKLALAGGILLCLLAFVVGASTNQRSAIGILICLSFSLFGYWFFFPGLFEVNLSYNMILSSITPRVLGILALFRTAQPKAGILEERGIVDSMYKEGEAYSMVQVAAQSDCAAVGLGLIFFGVCIYAWRLRHMWFKNAIIYSLPLLALLLTQLAVPYLAAPSFQLTLGFACFPVFKKMWLGDVWRARVK